jgi:hypothetical protein
MQRTRIALLASLMIALTVAAGQALAAVPNIELVTFLVFVSGYLLGVRFGAVIGACAMGAHSLFNVMGAAMIPVLVAQIVSYAFIGMAGGVIGPVLQRRSNRYLRAIGFGVVGGLLALAFKVVVNIASFYTFTGTGLWAYIWGGIVFTAIQIGWNAILFLLSMTPTLAVLSRYRSEFGAAT